MMSFFVGTTKLKEILMATKKKVVKKVETKKSRVSPEVPKSNVRFVRYNELNDGDAFLYEGKLWIKMDICDQDAICLDKDTGYESCLCDEIVEPVDITINWKRRN